MVLGPTGEITASSAFQQKRITEAVNVARLYLEGEATTEQVGKSLGITDERTAQIVRVGVDYMERAGWLHSKVGAGGSKGKSKSRS